MQHLSIVRNRNSSEWGLILIGQTWHTGRFCVQRDISQSFMIICIRSFMTIMCFRQMRLRFWSQKKTEPMGTSITCGCIVPVRCMRTDRSYCTITSLRVMQAVQEISSKSSGGGCVTDGYQGYHTIEKEHEDLMIAGCLAHARHRFDEAVKALPKDKKKSSLAYLALKQIQAIYREGNKLADKSAEERLKHRQLTVKPLVDAYFVWAKQNRQSVPAKSKTANGLTYSLNQEKYLRTFLENGEVPMDNNAAEQSIRPFCVGKKNWVMIDTVAGAEASAMIYSIAETAKANKLKPYNYFKYLLEEIPRHMDNQGVDFCEDLLPWSDKLPEC